MFHRFQVKQVKRKKKKEREYLAGGRRDQSKVVQDVLADLKIISRRVVVVFPPLLYVPKNHGICAISQSQEEQDKVNTADSASKSVVRLVRVEKMVLSGLVWSLLER